MAATFEAQADKIREANDALKDFNNLINQGKFGNEDISKSLQKQIGNYGILIESTRDLYKEQKIGRDDLQDVLDLTQDLSQGNKDLTQLAAMKAKYLADAADAEEQGAKGSVEQLKVMSSIVESEQNRVIAQEQSKALFSGMDGLSGGLLTKAKDFRDSFKGVNKGITGTFAILGLVLALMTALSAQTDAIGNEFGVIGVKDFKQDIMAANTAAIELGYSAADVATTTNELSSNFGMTVDEAAGLTQEVLGASRALNISVDDSAKLIGNLQATTSLSGEGAANLIKQTGALARSAGVAPKAIFADMAGATEEIAGYTDSSGENIAQAAVAARAMGMSLSDVTKIADDLLNVESSIQNEMEAEIMLGRDLQLDRARQLALAGDLAGVQEEILGQVGTEAEFNEMNVLERKAMAAAIGISVSQLGKMVTEAGKSKEELMSIRSMDMSEIIPKDAIGSITQMTNQFKSLGAKFMEIAAKITDTVGIWGTIAVVGVGLFIAAFAKMAIKMGMQILMQKLYKKSIDKTNESLATQTAGGGKGGGGGMKSLFSGIKPMDMIKGAAAILILAAALVVAAFAFQMFGDVTWPAVLMGLSTLAVLTVAALALGNVGTQVMAGALAIAVLSTALIPAAFAFSLLAGVDPMSIIAFAGSMVVLGAATFALGALMFTGVGALVFGAGVLALLSLGAAVMVLGAGMSLAAPHLGTFTAFLSSLGSTMETVQPQIETMDLLSSTLFGLAGALTAVGVAGILALPAFSILKGLGLLGGGEEAAGEEEESVSLVKDDIVSGQLQSVINAINEMKAEVIAAVSETPRAIGKHTKEGLLSGIGI